MSAIDLCELGLVPDLVARYGMRRLMAARLKKESLDSAEAEFERFSAGLETLRNSAIAESTDKANEQHYEVPTEFFQAALGPHLKYSACIYPSDSATLGEAERHTL